MNKMVFKRGARNSWINANAVGGGTCFTLSYDALEDLLKNGIGRRGRLADNEFIDRVEIDQYGITVFIGNAQRQEVNS